MGNNAENIIDPFGLWAKDVHSGIENKEYGTYTWAKDVGFSEEDARIIAKADNDVDSIFRNNSWLPYTLGDQSHHFNKRTFFGIELPKSFPDTRLYWADVYYKEAECLYEKGHKKAALRALGVGLHSIQDYYAHGNFVSTPQHLFHPSSYDDWKVNREAAWNTSWHSIYYLGTFKQNMR